MNRRQKELEQIFLDDEKQTLELLKENYQQALNDINIKIAELKGRDDADMQNVIYQLNYQKALQGQVRTILEQLQDNNYQTVSEYLVKSYEQGYIGTMYDLQGQGIPIIVPIDQRQVVIAIQNETKLSEDLYTALGKDTREMSRQIASEISRGIATSSGYSEIARNISNRAAISRNNAMRIARTEAHRIQNKAISDAQWKAKERGADIVKIWSAALDGRTRDTHRRLDGQIRELDEPFEIDGLEAMEPGDFGDPAEDCNCRCRCNSKARWLLDGAETKHLGKAEDMSDEDLQPIADKLGLETDELRDYSDQIIPVQAKDYEDFRNQYDDIVNNESEERVRTNTQKMTSRSTSPKEILENTDGSSTIKPNIVNDAIESGTVSKEINVDKQKRHIKDSDGYIEGRSYINGNLEDAQKFVDKLSGTGTPILDSKGNWTNKERVESSKVIGTHVNPSDGSETTTNKATITYSKTGSHIIPRKGED